MEDTSPAEKPRRLLRCPYCHAVAPPNETIDHDVDCDRPVFCVRCSDLHFPGDTCGKEVRS